MTKRETWELIQTDPYLADIVRGFGLGAIEIKMRGVYRQWAQSEDHLRELREAGGL